MSRFCPSRLPMAPSNVSLPLFETVEAASKGLVSSARGWQGSINRKPIRTSLSHVYCAVNFALALGDIVFL